MVNAKEIRKTLGRTMGKGGPSRPVRSKTRGAPHPQERIIPSASSGTREEERASRVQEQEQTLPVVNIDELEEAERSEGQLDTTRRREKRIREEVPVPPRSDAVDQAALNEGRLHRSGFLDSAVARYQIKAVMADEDSSWIEGKRHEEVFELAFHNSYKVISSLLSLFTGAFYARRSNRILLQATLLTAEVTARAYKMARLSRRKHDKCLELEGIVKEMEDRLKKVEDEKKEAEVKQGLVEAALALSCDRVKELERDVELCEGRIDELNHMVARLEASRPQIEKAAVQSFLQTEEFKDMVRVDSATSYTIGFEKCLKVLRKYYPDVDQSVLSYMEPSSDEEEEGEEGEPARNPEPLNVVPPSPQDTPKEA